MTRTCLAVIFSALLTSISSIQAVETATRKLNNWCTLTYPTQIEVGKSVKLKVAYKGLKKTKLYCDLHWKDRKGKKRGFMSGGYPRLEVEGDGESTFTAKISNKSDLGTVFPLIFTTPTGKWKDKELSTTGPDISIKGVVVIKPSAKKTVLKTGAAAPKVTLPRFLRPGNGFVEYTQKLQQALQKGKKVVIPAGNYLIKFNAVKIPSGVQLVGANRKTVFTGYGTARKKAILTIEGADNISISGITFKGQNNSAVAIKVINSVSRPSHHIKVNNNTAIEIGLLYSGPRKGFTYNRSRGPKKGWGHQGGVTKQMINYDIVVKNNICYGNRKFKPGNFKKGRTGVSSITFMYTKNALAQNNLIANYRFGIWAYGGAPKDSTNKKFSGSPLLCENIIIKDNCVSETFSPVWVSNTDKFEFSNNCASRTQDVAYDIEGSANGKIFNNISIDANGGSLTPLNGSRDSLFENNAVYEFRVKAPNICVVRDGNQQIIFRKNNFIRKQPLSKEEHSKVLIKNVPGEMPPNENILFEHNYFENVILKPKSGKKIIFKDNNFIRSKFIKTPGVDLVLRDNKNAENGIPDSEIMIKNPKDKSAIKASMPGSIVAELRYGSRATQVDFWLILPNQRWLALGKTKSAPYSKKLPANLVPGDYKAVVRATNSRGVASFDVVAFKIIKTK
jgi:hypothetical protein